MTYSYLLDSWWLHLRPAYPLLLVVSTYHSNPMPFPLRSSEYWRPPSDWYGQRWISISSVLSRVLLITEITSWVFACAASHPQHRSLQNSFPMRPTSGPAGGERRRRRSYDHFIFIFIFFFFVYFGSMHIYACVPDANPCMCTLFSAFGLPNTRGCIAWNNQEGGIARAWHCHGLPKIEAARKERTLEEKKHKIL